MRGLVDYLEQIVISFLFHFFGNLIQRRRGRRFRARE